MSLELLGIEPNHTLGEPTVTSETLTANIAVRAGIKVIGMQL
jgi:hypothetical protein